MTPDPSFHEHPPLAWEAEGLWRKLSPLLPGLSVEVMARADSTSTQLLQRLRGVHGALLEDVALPGRRAGDTQPCLLVAEHQTVGRGRMGRSWQAAPGGASLTFSLGLPLAPPSWSGLSLAVGVAIAEALDPAAGEGGKPRVGLKWPNDLWLDERKLGGILIETVSVGAQRMAVIGIGLNVLPMDVPALPTGYASLSEIEPGVTAPQALHTIAPALVRALLDFQRSGFAPFAARFAARDVLYERAVRSGAVEGVARGVTGEGALRVETPSAGMQEIVGNEVSVRLSAWGPTQPSGFG